MNPLKISTMPQPNLRINPNGNGSGPQSALTEILLSPSMSLGEAARTVLAFHFDRMVANEPGTMRGDDPEAVHDMRVATRNLRAALVNFRQVLPKRTVTALDKDLEWLAQLLGQIRDLDVFLDWLEAYARRAQGNQKDLVQIVVQDREQARTRERAALVDGLNSERYRDFKQTFAKFIQANPSNETQKNDSLVLVAASKIQKEMKRVRQRGKRANLNHLKRLHRLRIQCKRLRYTSEFFQTLFPDFPNKVIDRASKVQDVLGVVHDTDMYSQFLKKMRCAEPDDSPLSATLSRMIEKLHEEQQDRYKEFRSLYRRLGSRKFQRKMMRRICTGYI